MGSGILYYSMPHLIHALCKHQPLRLNTSNCGVVSLHMQQFSDDTVWAHTVRVLWNSYSFVFPTKKSFTLSVKVFLNVQLHSYHYSRWLAGWMTIERLHWRHKDDVTFTSVWHQKYSSDSAGALIRRLWTPTTDWSHVWWLNTIRR